MRCGRVPDEALFARTLGEKIMISSSPLFFRYEYAACNTHADQTSASLSQRYVPGWRGMGGDRPANGADDGWIPHKLPSQQEVHLVGIRNWLLVASCAGHVRALYFLNLSCSFLHDTPKYSPAFFYRRTIVIHVRYIFV